MRKAKFNVGDTVRLLDGKDIPNYSGFWMPSMKQYVGMETTVEHVQYDKYTNQFRYMVADADYVWDERGLEVVESKPNWKVLIVPIDGNVTEGRLIENDKVVKTMTTKKSKEDEYSIAEACKVITERLFEKETTEVDPFPTGTLVEVVTDFTSFTGVPKGTRGYVIGKGSCASDYVVDFKVQYPHTHRCKTWGYNLEEPTGYVFLAHDLKKVDANAI